MQSQSSLASISRARALLNPFCLRACSIRFSRVCVIVVTVVTVILVAFGCHFI